MSISIGMACNFYNERHAIAGLIESASQFFDDLVFLDCGPDGKPSTDGSLDILRSWGITPIQGNINDGFGVARTNLIRQSKTEFVMVLDGDERYLHVSPVFGCEGSEKYPETPNPNLTVTVENPAFNQGQRLRHILEHECDGMDAVRTCRRHWFDFTFKRPCQNWKEVPDFQLRIVRNAAHIGYDPKVRIHERLIDTRSGGEPGWFSGDQSRGPFHDHFSNAFKHREPEQNKEDKEIYEKLEAGCVDKMWLGKQAGVVQ